MTKLENTILYVLSRTRQKGIRNLSKFELFKLLYLLEVESYTYTGQSFFDSEVSFVRDKNGPISVDIYHALTSLEGIYIQIEEIKRTDYPHPRHGISLKKNVKKFALQVSEKLFINSVLESYSTLPINKLKDIVYNTQPMQKIQKEEKKQKVDLLKGQRLDFDSIPLDEDVLEMITS